MGWNGSNTRATGARSASAGKGSAGGGAVRPRQYGLIIGAVLVLAVIGGAVWWLTRGEAPVAVQDAPKTKRHARIVEVKPSAAPTNKVQEVEAPPVKDFSERRRMAAEYKAMTPEEQHQFRLAKLREKPLDLTPTTNRPFRTGLELSMARIFMTPLGKPPPPLMTTFLPIADEARLTEILIADNPVIEGDTEIAKESKAMVELAKKELRTYIKEGGDPETFLQHYYGKLVEAYEERKASMREVVRVAREEPDIANDFYKSLNEKLAAKGILPIELPEKTKLKLGLKD